jgi:membrane protease YdiL (CAAX protease family)
MLALKNFGPELSTPDERFYSFVIGSVSFQFVGLILAHAFLRTHEVTWSEFLGFNLSNFRRAVLLGLGIAILAVPVALLVNELSRVVVTSMTGSAEMQPTMKVLQVSVSLPQRILFGATAIVVAPLIEEILFRGILYRTLQQLGYPRLGLYGTSILFGLIHANLVTLLPLSCLAVVWALLYDRTNNLMASIASHSLFNAVNFFCFIHKEGIEQWFQEMLRHLQQV